MGGIIIGTLCLLGFVKVWRHHRCKTRGSHRGWMARRVAQKLSATPEQEKVLRDSLESLQRAGLRARGEWPAVRADAARALRAEPFDEAAFAAAVERARTAFNALESSTREALLAVHHALQPAQRQQLADLVEFGPRALR